MMTYIGMAGKLNAMRPACQISGGAANCQPVLAGMERELAFRNSAENVCHQFHELSFL
jgi:hypothetical protein